MEHWKFPPVLEAYLKIGVVLSLEGDFLQERVEITSALWKIQSLEKKHLAEGFKF